MKEEEKCDGPQVTNVEQSVQRLQGNIRDLRLWLQPGFVQKE